MIEELVRLSFVEIPIVVVKENKAAKENFFKKLVRNRKTIGYKIVLYFEHYLFGKNVSNAFALKNMDNILSAEKYYVTTRETKFSDYFKDEDVNYLKEKNIDIFIRLGYKILRGDVLHISRYGIWSFHHGDNRINRGSPAGTWEVLLGQRTTGAILQVLTEDLDKGIVLSRAITSTDKLSILRNRNNLYWRAYKMMIREVTKCHALGGDAYFSQKKRQASFFYCERLFTTPGNFFIIWKVLGLYLNQISKFICDIRVFYPWILLYKFENDSRVAESFFRYKFMISPKDKFWADPFVLFRDGEYYVFFEEYSYHSKKGHISVMKIKEDGKHSSPNIVLEQTYHLSYPFLIEDQEHLYMIPESCHNSTVELYECIEFPLKWELKKILLNNVWAADTTVVKHNGKFWLFTTVKSNCHISSNTDDLWLYYSDSLVSSEWHSHPSNPIVTDCRYGRCAGRVYCDNGRLYRPAQNCTDHYGQGVNVMEIVRINENEYEEKLIQQLMPNWSNKLSGFHTINSDGRLTIIDAIYRRKK
jgi:folate-dependent phosphoribosylglycinamide formyltransferase PurN